MNGALAYTPIGCGSPVLTGPLAPALASTECFALFSSDGAVTNSGVTYITGDVGTNVGLTTGFDPLLVTGTIYPNPFLAFASIMINDPSLVKEIEFKLYNILGEEVMKETLTKQLTTLDTSNLPLGIYFYQIISNKKTVQSGKLVSRK
jgi:hypothetical protein